MIKKEIKAVHDQDLERLLRDLGIFNDIKDGKKKCKICDCIINLTNLQALYPESGDIKTTCDKPECLKKLYGYLDEKGIN